MRTISISKSLSLVLIATLVTFAIACGGGGDPAAPDAGGGDPAPWVGDWSAAGTQSTTCGAATGTSQVTGLVTISAGRAGTIETLADNCRLVWDLDGARAALEPGQLCTVSTTTGNVTVEWTQSRASLDADTITADTTGATSNGCSFMQQLTLTRM